MQTWKCNKCGEKYYLYDMDCPPDSIDEKCNKKGCDGVLKYKEHGGDGFSSKIEGD